MNVFLKDNLTNTVHNLSESPYSLATEVGTFNSRFEIVYQEGLLGVTPIQFNESQVVIYKTPTDEIVINSGSTMMSTIKIFDIQGRLLYDKKTSKCFTDDLRFVSINRSVVGSNFEYRRCCSYQESDVVENRILAS